jgi:hypothetical protein
MGNKLGWIIATGLAVALIAFVLVRVFVPSVTPPTQATTQPGALELISPGGDIQAIIGYVPKAPGNAGDDYAKALHYYKENADDFREGSELVENQPKGLLRAYQLDRFENLAKLLAPGSLKKDMQFTFVHTPQKLKVTARADGGADLQDLADAMDSLCVHYYRDGKINQAISAGLCQFVLGWQMMNERRRADIVARGMDIQLRSCQRLAVCYRKKGDKSKARAAREHVAELEKATKQFAEKFRIVWATKANPGDIFNIIDNDADQTWQLEATLALGVLKFTAKGQAGDMDALEKHLAKAEASDDKLIRAAAKVARECTKPQIQSWAVGN